MTSKFDRSQLNAKNIVSYGQARTKDIAFDAVMRLWDLRKGQGMTQKDLANNSGIAEPRISRMFKGPGNWTFETLGALVAAMDGELEITALPTEDTIPEADNYQAYDDFADQLHTIAKKEGTSQSANLTWPPMSSTGTPRTISFEVSKDGQ